MNGRARATIWRTLLACCVISAVASVPRTTHASAPDEPNPVDDSGDQEEARPPATQSTPIVLKDRGGRSVQVDVFCQAPAALAAKKPPIDPKQAGSDSKCPADLPADGKPHGEQGGTPFTAEASDPPADVRALLVGETIVGVLVIIISVWLAFLGARLMGPSGVAGATDSFLFRRHWGGFGGESSGWNLSPPAGKCLAGLVLIVLGAGLALQVLLVLHRHSDPETPGTEQTSSANRTDNARSGKDSLAPQKPNSPPG